MHFWETKQCEEVLLLYKQICILLSLYRLHYYYLSQRFIGLHLSASYRLEKSDSNYFSYIGELIKVFDVYSNNGVLEMPNLTRSYAGTI